MKTDREQLAVGTAWITSDGVLFNGQYYSCRKALREGWYGKAGQEGNWQVHILFDSAIERHGVIYINAEEFPSDYLCHLLQRPAEPDYAAVYRERVRCLKEQRKQLIE